MKGTLPVEKCTFSAVSRLQFE